MAEKRRHISVKVLATVLSIALLFGALPQTIASVFATTEGYGALEALTSGAVIDNDTDNANITATFSENTTIAWADADASVGRGQAGYALGVKLVAADTLLKEEDFSKESKFVGYQVYTDGSWSEKISFWDNELSGKTDEEMQRYINLWGYVDEAALNEAIASGDDIEFKWQFDWNMDDTYDQTVTMTVAPEKITLNKSGAQVYPATDNAAVEAIGFGADVVGSEGSLTKVTQNADASIAWALASSSADITADGWWAGIKVTAPSAYGKDVLENATYQVKNDSSDWSSSKSFWANKASADDATTHYADLHRQLSENMGNEDIVTAWRFDWNNDGVFEQLVTLTLSPDKITLLGADGYQVYPSLGTVVALTGGEVSGSTGNVVVTLTSAEIPYENANTAIGKDTDGWWAGIKVNAPAFVDDVTVKGAKFRYQKYGDATFTEASFNDEKHSSADASEHWINLWVALSQEIISDAKNANEDIVSVYEFDWDGNGSYEQKVTFTIVPSDAIVLKKISQTGFAFMITAPVDQWVGDTFTNTASGGESAGAVKYEIIEGGDIATIDENTGKLTFSGTGKVRVQATKAGDSIYEDATATYLVTVDKLGQTGFKFATSNAEITYQEGATYSNIASGGESDGNVTYKDISNNGCITINEMTGEVTILKAGDVTIEATKEGNDLYKVVTTTYTLKIKKADQNAVTFVDAPATIKYTTEAIDRDSILKVAGGSGSGEFVYSITSGEDVAEFDLDGNVVIKKADAEFEVSVIKLGDDCYNNSQTIKTTIKVEKANQSGFSIKNGDSVTLTYNENTNKYSIEVDGGESTSEVVYEVISGDCATVDEAGIVSVIKAGTVEIKATRKADANYLEASDVITIEVKRATQSFTFKDGKNISKLYGTLSYKNDVVNTVVAGAADGKGYSTSEPTYAIVGENNIGVELKADGTIEFTDSVGKVGKITIQATKAPDDCYEGFSDTYELELSYLETSDKPVVSGDKTDSANDWYTGNVKINAPAGYQISTTNELTSSAWGESVPYSTEKIGDATVYLKNSEGFITDAIVVSDIKLDTSAPSDLAIEYEKSFIDVVLEGVSFGIYKAKTLAVTLKATDTSSGINNFVYSVGGKEVTVNNTDIKIAADGQATYTFIIDSDTRSKISFKAIDVAGRVSEIKENGQTLVVDLTAPEINVSYDYGENTPYLVDDVTYTQGEFIARFEITEENFDLAKADGTLPEVIINDISVALTWTKASTGVWEASQVVKTAGINEIVVKYTDLSDNTMEEYTNKICIDGVKPVLSVKFDNSESDGIYATKRVATITVTEEYFDAQKVKFIVTAKNILGNTVALPDYAAYLNENSNWVKQGSVYTATLELGDDVAYDGIYDITFDYVDYAGNKADTWTDSFVIDHTPADNIKIVYSSSILDKVLNTLTFGLYKEEVEVTVTADDITSGVDYFNLTYTKQADASDVNKDTFTVKLDAAVADAANKFTASYKIPASARGTVSVEAVDNAGNSSSKADNKVIVVDDIVPEIKAEYKFTNNDYQEANGIFYTQDKTEITFTITEANFDLIEDKVPVVKVNDTVKAVEWTKVGVSDNWNGVLVLDGNGDYVVTVEFVDLSTNEMVKYEQEIHIDSDKPLISVSYDNNEALNTNNYKADRTATVTITAHNFRARNVDVNVVAKDILGNDVSVDDFKAYAKNPANWISKGDVHTLVLPEFTVDAKYDISIDFKDLAGNEADIWTDSFVIDHTPADNIKIVYSSSILDKVLNTLTFGLYKEEVEVTVTADDITSGVDYFNLTYTKQADASNVNKDAFTVKLDAAVADAANKFTASYKIPASARGTVSVEAVDNAGNSASKADDKVIVVDDIIPEIKAEYKFDEDSFREENNIYYTQGETEITFTITEANFDLIEDKVPVVKVNGEVKAVEWTRVGKTDDWKGVLILKGNGDYTVTVDFVDLSTNEMKQYKQEVRIDSVKPVIEVEYDNNEALNTNNYKADRTATVTITAHNFKANEAELTVVAKDILGNDVSVEDFKAFAKNPANWDSKGDVHTLVLPVFTVDARYDVSVDYTDLADNKADTWSDSFVVDHVAPDNIGIKYSESLLAKALNAITFGLYKEEVEVTVTADDITSGVDYFNLTYTKQDGASDVNKDTFTVKLDAAVADAANKFTASYKIPASARGTVSVEAVDNAGNSSSKADNKVIVVDDIVPEIRAEYKFDEDSFREENNIYYTQGETEITFTITEANFDLIEDKVPVVKVNGEVKAVEWTRVGTTDDWKGILVLSGDNDYVVTVDFVDLSTNEMNQYKQEVRIDSVKPVIEVEYDNNDALNTNNYKADRTATITVTEHNFKADEVELIVVAKDILGNNAFIEDFKAFAKNPANWDSKGDVHTLVLPVFTVDARYDVFVDYIDLAGNNLDTWSDSFVIDHTDADNINIEYSESIIDKIIEAITFGFYQSEVEVTVTADDITSGVDYFNLTYTKQDGASNVNKETFTENLVAEVANSAKEFTASYKIPASARGTVAVEVVDKAGNSASKADDKVIVVDDIAPDAEVIYSAVAPETTVNFVDAQNKDVDSFASAEQAFYNGNVIATIVIDEANFFEGKEAADGIIHEIGIKLTKTDDDGNVTEIEYLPAGSAQKYSGAKAESIEWKSEGDVHTAVIEYSDDADYVLTVEYADFSTNDAEIKANDGKTATMKYESKIVTVDKTAPVIKVEYDNNEALNTNNYKADRTATITVTEHNFRSDEMVVNVTARDITGEKVTVTDYAGYVVDEASWTKNGNDYVAKITYSTDAIYTFDISYTDLANNESADFEEQEFVVDHKAPENIKIEYSTPVIEKILETITFGFYKADVKLTITAEDITSGVDYFTLTYNKEADSSEVNAKSVTEKLESKQLEDSKTFEATYVLPANARGHFSVDVTDKAGNTSSRTDDKLVKIVDTIAPEISIEYSATNEETKVNFIDAQNKDIGDFASAEQAFYNGNVIATIVLNEANFFEGKEAADGIIHEIGIKLTKTDDDGNVTEIEYLPAGSAQKYSGAKAESIEWKSEGDVHTAVIEYSDDADYVLTVEYADFSTNDAEIKANDGKTATKKYESKTVTVDKTAPVIWVEYDNENVIHTIEGRDYFDNVQSATVTVVEHNFRATDMIGTVIAENVIGEKIAVNDYAAQMSDENNWIKSGNTYTIKLEYPVDANYSFDYEYCDLAKNAVADYEADMFTVDTTAPENLEVKYSTSVMEKVLETITFGYYNAKMQVTISAEDVVAGVHYFVYSYLKNEGVSEVNRELLNDVIEDANENITHDGKKATTSFTIPKDVLVYDYQFNGIVEFTAFDRAENNNKKVDNTVIIVDNINPVAQITYNEPVQQANGISYYAGNIDAKIVIQEANFYAEDVIVTITKDGLSYASNVTWVDNSVDIHTGTFTLTEDGDYIVTVKYMDRSTNEMETYVSNRLTLDTKQPTINVSNIVMNSANKDERYPFTITADDINIDSSSFMPVLTATVRNEDGDYETKKISLGSLKTVQSGKTYAYSVDNLTEDAVYSLVCTVKDMAGNSYSKIILKDGAQYDTVRFSINREGSTFSANKATEKLSEQYYVYSVENDIVIEEINVDPIEKYVLKINGKELVEGRDYTTTISSNSGEWSKRTYIISKDLFAEEGEYTIVVESTDKTETTAYSDVKNVNVSFVVDQSKPVLTISGLESEGRYQIDEQIVTVIPTDDGGRLNAMKVIITDEDGNPIKDANGKDISVRFDMSGDELFEYLSENDGKITFTIPEGFEQNVRIICEDCAVNESDEVNVYDEVFEKVTVSQSGWVIFYANKPLFYGSIAGVAGLAIALFLIIFFKKKKDKKEEQ